MTMSLTSALCPRAASRVGAPGDYDPATGKVEGAEDPSYNDPMHLEAWGREHGAANDPLHLRTWGATHYIDPATGKPYERAEDSPSPTWYRVRRYGPWIALAVGAGLVLRAVV